MLIFINDTNNLGVLLFSLVKKTCENNLHEIIEFMAAIGKRNDKYKKIGKNILHVIIVIRTYSLGTRTEPAVLRTYLENQAILEPILLYRASKCKQTKEQGSEDCLWTHIFTFL